MKYRNSALRVFLLTIMSAGLLQGYAADDGRAALRNTPAPSTHDLIVMLKGDVASGAGIIFGRENDTLYIATANHNVRKGVTEAQNVEVMLRGLQDTWLKASLTKHFDPQLDLAVVSVPGVSKLGIDFCDFTLDQLGNTANLDSGDLVFPVGYPNGVGWGAPINPDGISKINGDEISFQSLFIRTGHSGGGLITQHGQLIGMIVKDQDPFGRAISIDAILMTLKQWGYPIYLRMNGALHNAAKAGVVDEVRTLLTRCGTVDERKGGVTALHVAALHGQANVVRLLLAQGADVNAIAHLDRRPIYADNPDWTALHFAAHKNFKEVVQILLDHRAQIDFNKTSWSTHESTPLEVAVKAGATETVKVLLERGANVKWPNPSGGPTPLHLAAEQGEAEIVKALLARGVDVNHTFQVGRTALSVALAELQRYKRDQSSSSEMRRTRLSQTIKVLFAHGAKVDPKLLTDAVEEDNVELVGILLAQGADPYPELFRAIRRGSNRMLETLLAHRPDVNRENKEEFRSSDRRPLMLAASLGKVEEVKLLLKAGAKVNLADSDGETPLGMALWAVKLSEGSPLETMKVLLAAGADANSVNLGALLWDNHIQAVELLLAHGANANLVFRTPRGENVTLLHVAAESGKVDNVKVLLKAGAKANAVNADGETPLYAAVDGAVSSSRSSIEDFVEIIGLLIRAGADVNARDRFGNTALSKANSYKTQIPQVIEVLRAHGARER